MTPYMASFVPEEELKLFEKIEIIVREMPDVDFSGQKLEGGRKPLVSCHMVARALAKFFPVKYHDGYCGDCQHSWLTTKTGNIIDAYPVGILGGPMLIATEYFHPFTPLYVKSDLSVTKDAQFKKNAEKVAEVMRRTMDKLGIGPEIN